MQSTSFRFVVVVSPPCEIRRDHADGLIASPANRCHISLLRQIGHPVQLILRHSGIFAPLQLDIQPVVSVSWHWQADVRYARFQAFCLQPCALPGGSFALIRDVVEEFELRPFPRRPFCPVKQRALLVGFRRHRRCVLPLVHDVTASRSCHKSS